VARDAYYLDARSVAQLPSEWKHLVVAADLVCAVPRFDDGWRAFGYPDAPPEPLRAGAPPYDGVHRGSWTSPGVCLRLDLDHPVVPPALRDQLRRRSPDPIGADGAWYRFGVDSTSQRVNRDAAVAELVRQIRASGVHL
jgi:hypothetical protein